MEFAAGPTTVICGMNLIEAFGEFRIMPRIRVASAHSKRKKFFSSGALES
jgi:hypothetical protein